MATDDFFTNGSHPLTRFRSAPTSFLAALMESATENSSSGDDESDSILSAFISDSDPGARPGNGGFGSYSIWMNNCNSNNGNVSSSSALLRQSSFPAAGFFNGFGITGEVGSYKCHNLAKPVTSSSGMANHIINFSSGSPSSSGFMPENNGITYKPWQSNSLKRNWNGEVKMLSEFYGLENQDTECRRNSTGLVDHLSSPAEVDNKYLQFQQVVPCKLRAKRGCATHPRSIAERIRRTRISQRIKKLQDLFPNMDKHTTTVDMLDLAVEHIKDLQKQIQTLSDSRSNCICWNEEMASPTV